MGVVVARHAVFHLHAFDRIKRHRCPISATGSQCEQELRVVLIFGHLDHSRQRQGCPVSPRRSFSTNSCAVSLFVSSIIRSTSLRGDVALSRHISGHGLPPNRPLPGRTLLSGRDADHRNFLVPVPLQELGGNSAGLEFPPCSCQQCSAEAQFRSSIGELSCSIPIVTWW
jgi:hypothetical protein